MMSMRSISKILGFSALALCGAVSIWFGWHFYMASTPDTVSVGKVVYTLAIADTDEKRARGLSGQESLCVTCAMLFVFEKPDRYPFWMNGMLFPLDIAWLSSDGVVVHIEHHISQGSREIYYPQAAALQVLEFNAGVLDTFQVGDVLHFSF